jgi:hypothetical protein
MERVNLAEAKAHLSESSARQRATRYASRGGASRRHGSRRWNSGDIIHN